jgi:hypothetical protein
MSPKKDKNVPQLVEKYKQLYPAYERRDLRKQIRLENPSLFNEQKNSSYQSNLKKLDRYLRKAFQNSKDKTIQKPENPKDLALRWGAMEYAANNLGGSGNWLRALGELAEKEKKNEM